MYISRLLLNWYKRNGRELPWRETKDPYKIWVSEIILQQTRINQGMAYYNRFIERFPDVQSLANADIQEVLNLWQGLGYYSRARNMHYAAKTITSELNGHFPRNYSEIKMLKGVGEYTAGAIASISFNEPVPAIDGNVKRVVSRLFMIYEDVDKPAGLIKIREKLVEHLDKNNPGTFNQAVMDLGSMICKPVNPECDKCPLSNNCEARRNDRVQELPVKYKKLKSRNRYFYYLIISLGEKILIGQRTKKDIWELLYEFPLIETDRRLEEKEIFNEIITSHLIGKHKVEFNGISDEIIHILSHQKIHARFIHLITDSLPGNFNENYILIKRVEIDKYPLPRLIERYLSRL
jgi:A/G-specific adenine glycosylase